MTGLWTIAKREFLGFFYAPIAYVVGVAFLAVQGFSFWALMRALSDPSAPAEVGAVLRSFFGGTLLHWFTVFALVALLSMRSVAEDRRSGLWECILTTRVHAVTVLVGKWLALVAFYALLWMPSIFLVYIFTRYLPDGQALDLGPVYSSYLGVVIIGASLMAIGVAVSAATENQVIAAVVSFSLFLGWLMLGEYGGLGGDTVASGPWFLRQHLAALARGEIHSAGLVSLGSITIVALTFAAGLAARDRGDRLRLFAAAACLCLAGGSLSSLTARHGPSFDWSAGHTNSLEPSTIALLGKISEPVEVVVIRPSESVFDSVHSEVMTLLRRMQSQQLYLKIKELDPLAYPTALREWAYDLAIRTDDLSSGGAVLFQQGSRRRVVDLLAMASFGADDLGVGALSEFRAESSFRVALTELTNVAQERLCVSTGHGEIPMTAGNPNWSVVAGRLENEGITLHAIRVLDVKSLERCDALIMMGPSRKLASDEVLALNAFWTRGGDSVIAMRSRPEPGSEGLPRIGLELLLEARGMHALHALVVDPGAELELRPAWMTYKGYGEHPIVSDYEDRRATVWDAPVALAVSRDDVVTLVRASPQAWSEVDLPALIRHKRYERGPDDSEDVAVALAQEDRQGSRLVLLGSAESMSSIWSERGIGGNDHLLVSSLLWILDRQVQLAAENKRPEHLRLLMTEGQLRSSFVWCVIVGPLFFAIFGAGLWWWRRREA